MLRHSVGRCACCRQDRGRGRRRAPAVRAPLVLLLPDRLRSCCGAWRRSLGRDLLRSPEALPLATLITLIEAIDRAQRLEMDFAAAVPTCARLLGGLWRDRQTDWNVAGAAAAWALSLHREVEAGAAPREVLKLRFTPALCAELLRCAQEVGSALDAYRQKWSALDTRLAPGPELFPAGWEETSIAAQHAVLDAWLAAPERLWHHVGYRTVRDEAVAAGLPSLGAIADEWTTDQPPLPWVLESTWLEGLLRRAFSERHLLAAFDAPEHEQLVTRFADMDRSVLRLNRARVATAHHAALPSRAGGGAMGILATQIGLKQRHLPIRRLMERCWQPVLAIKPILMMSPMSVAMFLPPDGPRFDLVIFDEASQVRPGTPSAPSLRGRQVSWSATAGRCRRRRLLRRAWPAATSPRRRPPNRACATWRASSACSAAGAPYRSCAGTTAAGTTR
jgi:hypothetical protein